MTLLRSKEPRQEIPDDLLETLLALVEHPRLKAEIRKRAEEGSPTLLIWEACRLQRAEKVLFPEGTDGCDLEELREEVLTRLPEDLVQMIDELRVIALITGEDTPASREVQRLLTRAFHQYLGEVRHVTVLDFARMEGVAEELGSSASQLQTRETAGLP